MSLFNIAGRVLWSSVSDKIGRFAVYNIYFTLGMICYSFIPLAASHSVVGLIFVLGACLSMYGGGFAAVPPYIKDLFGVEYAGSIHGRIVSSSSGGGGGGGGI